jgi:hypothetical protein
MSWRNKMDVDRFRQELAELVTRHGGQLVAPVEIDNNDALHHEHYVHPVPEMRGLHMFSAFREVQPIRIKVSIDVAAPGDWTHGINYTPMHSIPYNDAQPSLF